MIVLLFIEVPKDKDFLDLENLLKQNGYAFYDVTKIAYHTQTFHTLEEIEADIEDK